MEAKYTLLSTDENGNEVRLYNDGSKRNQLGHLLEYNGKGNELITPETARAYSHRRKQKILEAIEAKLTDITRTSVPSEAIAEIVGKRARVAMSDDTRTGNDAAKIVLSAVDAYQDKVEQTRTNVQRHEYVMDDETKQLLEQILAERRQDDGTTTRTDESEE